LAREFHLAYIDSGAMYRAVTLQLMRTGLELADDVQISNMLHHLHIRFKRNPDTHLNETYIDQENVEQEIRTMAVSNQVSEVSAIPQIRRAMVHLQQKAGKNRSIVMDGRDIGTTVFPDAAVKIFMTASPEVRAARRHLELLQKGQNISFEEILANLAHRDHEDSTRAESPLRQATDAVVLDNTHLSEDEQLAWAVQLVNTRLAVMQTLS
jgi:cytidylate kinase